MSKKEIIIKILKDSCERGGILIDDIRWDENKLFCTLNTSYFGIIKDVRVIVTNTEFKFKWRDEIMGTVTRSECDYIFFYGPSYRGTRKTIRKKNIGI